MIVEIDEKSGFCFGVRTAIVKAEEMLKAEGMLYSLGHIVHNEQEVERLQKLGLQIITHEEFSRLKNCKVLIRTHGEPPSTYEYAKNNNISLIDATCPVVLKLQERVKKSADEMAEKDGQVVIFGHQEHAEVISLTAQMKGETIVIDNPDELDKIDPKRSVVVFSQTTKSLGEFKKLTQNIQNHSESGIVEIHDTICRQVSNRAPHLQKFASSYDIVIFVGGQQSSNARVLFDICRKINRKTYFVSSSADLRPEWFSDLNTVGICGATSTPNWLMEKVAEEIKLF